MNSLSDHNTPLHRALNLAMRYLGYRPRTVHEVKTYLKKKAFDEKIINKTIHTLIENRFLDDKAFARLFIETKIKYKPKSTFALRYELKKKGISPTISDTILEQYNDTDLALKSLKPKLKTWQRLDNETIKKKVMNFLQYRGFNYDICVSTMNRFIELKDSTEEI